MKVAVVGASGYVGAELVALLFQHDQITLEALLVSENSASAGQLFSELHPKFKGLCDLPLQAFSVSWLENEAKLLDAVFLATPHQFSAQYAEYFLTQGIKVFDLSGAFRLSDATLYPKFYHFSHDNVSLLEQASYGLAEWQAADIVKARLIAVPGCYPTASLLALKPITTTNLQRANSLTVINGVSGVSGAGRAAQLATSFNEVSLTPYNILQHRHQPEISQHAGCDLVFNPHLAPYKRGLLVTITLQVKAEVTDVQINQAFINAYENSPLVRITSHWPKVDHVAYTPFVDLHWQYDCQQQVLVVSCAIDNLLKGAASQAIQCANISLGLESHYGLMAGNC